MIAVRGVVTFLRLFCFDPVGGRVPGNTCEQSTSLTYVLALKAQKMISETGPTKRQKTNSADRCTGVIFTLSAPSKVKQAANALLALLDPLQVEVSNIDKSDAVTGSVSDAIDIELRELKKANKRFKFSCELSRGVGLIAFSKTLIPSEFVYDLLSNNCPSVPPLFVCRIDPVDVVCAPNLVSFETVCLPAIKSKFQSLSDDVTWKVVYDKHGESNLSRDKAIEMIQSVIEDRHEVSIHAPDVTIMIHIFQSMLGVGFLKDYDSLCEYNIRKLVASRQKNTE